MENRGEFSSFDELLEELNKIKNTKDIENIEEIIQKAHRIKNTTQELKKENERLSNRFGLVWKNIPEKFVKYVSDTEIVYDKKLYEYICERKNSNEKSQTLVQFELESKVVKAKKEAMSFSFSFEGIDYLTYSNKIYKFKNDAKEGYIPYLNKKGYDFKLGDNKKDLIIEGENYFALQSLLYTHKNKIDVIYVDPPYNTGNKDFKYNDCFLKDEDGDRHSAWLSFMEKRLKLARNLLTEKGLVFISIDENENHRLKLLCDKIFGEKNFISNFIWQKKTGGGQAKYFYEGHEYCLIYSKSKELLEEMVSYKEISSTKVEEDDKNYYYLETDKIRKKHGKYDTKERRCHYEDLDIYKNEKSIKEIKEKIRSGVYVLVEDKNDKGKHFIAEKHLLKKINNKFYKKIKPYSIITSPQGKDGNTELEYIFMTKKSPFENPKPIEYLKKFINSVFDKDITVLDFFAGSGSTGHAVWDLNKEDGGSRRFILCTNNENNICEEVTFERLKRANEKYGYGQSLEYLKLQHASINQIQNADKNKNFGYLKELINLKYNSFEVVEDNEDFYVNENIAVLKSERKMEEFFETYKNHENFAFLSSYKTGGYEKFKKLAKNMTDTKEENVILLSDNYIEEIKEIIKEEE